MLVRLTIQNYALINQSEIHFSTGMNVITGETGAGKSIMLGALGLLLGNRVDSTVLKDQAKKCFIEAEFNLAKRKEELTAFFQNNELDFDGNVLVRREVSAEGKSRAFINDTPVTLPLLKELGGWIIDIHSQHETASLNDKGKQLAVIDAVAMVKPVRLQYEQEFRKLQKLKQELNALVAQEQAAKNQADYNLFLYEELTQANVQAGEEVIIEQELSLLLNAETIKKSLVEATNCLSGDMVSGVQLVKQAQQLLQQSSRYNAAFSSLSERLSSVYVELKDIVSEIENAEDEIVHDAQRIELLTEKLNALNRLLQKHQVKTADELIEIKQSLEDKLAQQQGFEEQVIGYKKQIEDLTKQLTALALEIRSKRLPVMATIEQDVQQILSQLGMPHARLFIQHKELLQMDSSGLDEFQFMFTANKGSEPRELGKVASGGELSRVMFALKFMLGRYTNMPTIIFDEIDTGVSGEVAAKMAQYMASMAQQMQVVSITHLPQIASQGKHHLFVFKEEQEKTTHSRIRLLTPDERVLEIAKMLSSENPTAAAMVNAKELLSINS